MTRRLRPDIPLAETVYQSLVADLSCCRRQGGDRIVEAEIARSLNVSRTPVREALGRLVSDGLVTEAHPGGYAVITPSRQDIHEIFEIRAALEPIAFEDVVRTGTAEGDRELDGLLDGLAAAGDAFEAMQANIAFRKFWIERIANRRLREVLARFDMQVHVVRTATLVSDDGRRTARDGAERLAHSYRTRDTRTARETMRRFIADALHFFDGADTASPPIPPAT